jgi:hypothetical protein
MTTAADVDKPRMTLMQKTRKRKIVVEEKNDFFNRQ